MKLISLNIWGGRFYEPLINFLKDYSNKVDIFCFQEVFNNAQGVTSKIQKDARLNIFSDLKEALADFNPFINPSQENEESLAVFVRKNIKVENVDELFLYREKNSMIGNDVSTYPVNLQYFSFVANQKKFTVCNLHGHWTPDYKGDNPARLEQSKRIKTLIDTIDGMKILCGDFNLAPDTESMAILETSLKNLIKEYGITSTRSHYYTKGIKFADYMMVSPEIEVKHFGVLQDPVSDHLPLLLEFN